MTTLRKVLILSGVGIVAIVAILLIVVRVRASRAENAKAAAARQERPVPVTVEPARREDVPVYVEGLGTVTALYTVTVRTLVDGRLESVSYVEGQRVKRGEPLALVDPRPFLIQEEQATAARARDLATQHNAEITLDRDADQARIGIVSQQQVDNDRAAVQTVIAAVGVDEAQIHAAALDVQYAHIVSPIDGVTGIRLVDPGNIVHTTDANGIVVLTQLDPIAVIFTLPEDDLPRVSRARAHGAPRVVAFTRDGSTELGAGRLTVVDNLINQQTATLRLKAEMPNPDLELWPNQFVKARLLLEIEKGVLVVPAAAVQHGPAGTFVYVVDATSHAQMRTVAADEIEGDRAIVTKGLSPGERVVVEGQAQLKPGSSVAIQPASKSP